MQTVGHDRFWQTAIRLHEIAIQKIKYGQRWQVETANSRIKRTMGSALRVNQDKGTNLLVAVKRNRPISANAQHHDSLAKIGFLQSRPDPFSPHFFVLLGSFLFIL